MSVDCSLYLFFPIEKTTQALRAIHTLMVAVPDAKFTSIVAPDGAKVRFPAFGEVPPKTQNLQEDELVEFLALFNPGENGGNIDDDAGFSADVMLELGERYLEVQFSSSDDQRGDRLLEPPFPDQVLAVIAEVQGIAVWESMGDWAWLADSSDRFNPSEEEDRYEVGIDAFVDYLIELQNKTKA